jgi:hypothetical protein
VRNGIAAGAALALALLAAAGSPALADSILEFAITPAAPTTGDRLRLEALVRVAEDCLWQASASIAYGPQAELGPADGWGIDLRLIPGEEACLPVAVDLPVSVDLGHQPPGSGSGVLRLRVRGVTQDTRFFVLEVRPGPAPGWRQPALHGGYVRLTQSAALTFVPDRLVMADRGLRRLLLLDPGTGEATGSLPAPGNGDVRGLAWDGAHLYASVRDTVGPRLYKLDLLGRVLDSFPSPTVSPGNEPLEGLGFLDGILYGVLASPSILFAIDPATRQTLWSRSLPVLLRGLDAVPEGLVGIDAGASVYRLSPLQDGADLLLGDAIDNGLPSSADIQGFAHDGDRGYAWNAQTSEVLFVRSYAVWWAVDGGLHAYLPERGLSVDVARGEVRRIRQLSGNVDLGPLTCLIADGPGGTLPGSGAPPPGEAWFYVARFTSAEGFQLSYGRSTAGFRRLDLSSACP